MKTYDRVMLGHGSGGLMTHRLVQEVFVRRLENPALNTLDDAARFTAESTSLAMSTDCFVVDPLFFAGGNIGKLAVCGTVNDLLVAGARPCALTAGFILEEGLPMDQLEQIVDAMAATAKEAKVAVVAGDTKVVPPGKADGCFITTAGVGVVAPGAQLGGHLARPGDLILVSGTIGDHGAAIMSGRAGIELTTPIISDCAPLTALIEPLLEKPEGIHTMRDPTRGGLGTTLCEIAGSSGVTLKIDEQQIPVGEAVHVTCELLGLDPLYLACEGRVLIMGTPAAVNRALEIFHATDQGAGAAIIGEVQEGSPQVVCKTAMGGHRLVTMLTSDPLPRIC